MTTPDHDHDDHHDGDPELNADGQLRLHHLRVGLPPGPMGWDQQADALSDQLGEILAPFVAWLATQTVNEDHRRNHRDAVERYLRWYVEDEGPVGGRRHRYERHLHHRDPEHLGAAKTGLDWWEQHRRLLAVTLPVDE